MTNDAANWAYAEDFIPEDEVILAARDVADQLGCVPVLPGAARVLQLLAQAMDATSVVEIGTGAGVSAVYLLRGMNPDGILTTIDLETEHHRAAKQTLAAAGFPVSRTRMIAGRALDVLPRLTDGGYDLVFVDANKADAPIYLEHALRLLRVGGMVIMDNALWHGRVPDPAQRDHDTTAVRQALKAVREDDTLTAMLVSSGDGLLVAIKN